MGKWEMVRLGDVCIIERGGSPRPIEKYITNSIEGINWIKIGDTTPDSMYITQTKEKIIPEGMKKSRYVKPEDFLLSNSMSFGRPYILKIDGCIHDGWLVIRDENSIFDKRFLFYYLGSEKTYAEFRSLVEGGVVSNLNSKMVRDLYIPLPPLQIQQKIADILDSANTLIEKRKAQIAKLDLLVKSKFIEMFGDLYEIEKWSCTQVEAVANVTVGVVIKPAQYYTKESNGIRAFRSLNVGEMHVRDGDWVYFTPEGHENNMKSELHEGDVLVVRSGYPGTSCIVTADYAGCNAIDIIIARPDKSVVNPLYLSAFTNFPHGKTQIETNTGGAAQQHLNVGAYKKMTIAVPPYHLQNRFAEFVQATDKSKSEIQRSLDKLELLYKSLMQQYFC